MGFVASGYDRRMVRVIGSKNYCLAYDGWALTNTADKLVEKIIHICYWLLAGDKHWDETVIVASGAHNAEEASIAASFLLFSDANDLPKSESKTPNEIHR